MKEGGGEREGVRVSVCVREREGGRERDGERVLVVSEVRGSIDWVCLEDQR